MHGGMTKAYRKVRLSANPIDELGAAVDRVDEVDKTVDLRVHAVKAVKTNRSCQL